MVEGINFTVYMDHKPLTKSLSAKQDNYSPRQIRQLELSSQFTSEIRYIKDQENEVADALPRTTINALTTNRIDYHGLLKLQETDIELNKLRSDDRTSLVFEDVSSVTQKYYVICQQADGVHPFQNHYDGRYLKVCTTYRIRE
ncbi:unnamed protein product [Schistosoma rodhaini]|uniref:Reverse transcriptase RNase H-like domain-containing protein n=1 Tax=Schistosoma rodhaini TaxID=6188 RepID=A0AA85FP43_9TREM|nr:unnamed protein product [Schistosoma rodhaini]